MQALHVLGILTLTMCANTFVFAVFINENSTHDKDSHVLVLDFLSLELETCGAVRWCTLNVTVTKQSSYSCCQGCTCDPRCGLSGSCCPDYEFGQQTDWQTYTAIYDFVGAFLNWTDGKGYNDDQGSSRGTTVRPTTKQRGQCLRAQVRKSSKYREDGGHFNMIIECSATNDTDNRIKQRCELDYHKNIESGESVSMLSFEDLVPVTSQEDFEIYKNSHCLACSSTANATRSAWQIYAVCSRQQLSVLYNEHFTNPNSLLLAIVLNRVAVDDCNIIFEPDPRDYKKLKKHKCSKFDFDKCPASNGTEPDICTRYVSPIIEYSGPDRTQVIYKNAACIKCREDATEFVNHCYTTHDSRRLKIRLNVPRDLAGLSVTEHVEDLLHVRFPANPQHGCRAGEVYDRRADVCRKMYCPKGMFALRGECQSFFMQVEDGVFSVILRVVPTSPFSSHTDLAVVIYNKTRLMAENNRLIAIKIMNVWINSKNKFLLTLVFTVTKGTFSDAIKFTKLLVKTTWSTKASLFTVSLANWAKRVSRAIIDLNNGDIYKLEYPKLPVATINQYSRLEITEHNFCYRVLLSKDEYDLVPYKDAIRIKSSGKTIYQFTHFDNDAGSNELVCTEHVIEQLPDVKNDQVGRSAVAEKPEREEESMIEDLIPPLLLALTAVLAMGTCLARKRLAQRVIQQNNTA